MAYKEKLLCFAEHVIRCSFNIFILVDLEGSICLSQQKNIDDVFTKFESLTKGLYLRLILAVDRFSAFVFGTFRINWSNIRSHRAHFFLFQFYPHASNATCVLIGAHYCWEILRGVLLLAERAYRVERIFEQCLHCFSHQLSNKNYKIKSTNCTLNEFY